MCRLLRPRLSWSCAAIKLCVPSVKRVSPTSSSFVMDKPSENFSPLMLARITNAQLIVPFSFRLVFVFRGRRRESIPNASGGGFFLFNSFTHYDSAACGPQEENKILKKLEARVTASRLVLSQDHGNPDYWSKTATAALFGMAKYLRR